MLPRRSSSSTPCPLVSGWRTRSATRWKSFGAIKAYARSTSSKSAGNIELFREQVTADRADVARVSVRSIAGLIRPGAQIKCARAEIDDRMMGTQNLRAKQADDRRRRMQ